MSCSLPADGGNRQPSRFLSQSLNHAPRLRPLGQTSPPSSCNICMAQERPSSSIFSLLVEKKKRVKETLSYPPQPKTIPPPSVAARLPAVAKKTVAGLRQRGGTSASNSHMEGNKCTGKKNNKQAHTIICSYVSLETFFPFQTEPRHLDSDGHCVSASGA